MKTIFTVIPYFFNTDDGVFTNEVMSFSTWDEAYLYANTLGRSFDIIENKLN
jgi:hypothetical protein